MKGGARCGRKLGGGDLRLSHILEKYRNYTLKEEEKCAMTSTSISEAYSEKHSSLPML
ncbi:hypothetical protein KAX75_07005 [candidate division WOR-3 bacterium]|nr:hypothetical protein [candidate division WOR-3 bacterium]